MARVAKSTEERFWKAVDKTNKTLEPNECWLFSNEGQSGYGCIAANDRKSIQAHRFSWELHNGPVPAGMVVSHLCNVKRCVNPNHLAVTTQKANLQYMIACGRNRRYKDRKPPVRMTEMERLQAVVMYLAGANFNRIARALGRRHQHISQVITTNIRRNGHKLIETLQTAQKELLKEVA